MVNDVLDFEKIIRDLSFRKPDVRLCDSNVVIIYGRYNLGLTLAVRNVCVLIMCQDKLTDCILERKKNSKATIPNP